MLLLLDDPNSHCTLIAFINSLKKSGLFILGHVHTAVDNPVEKDPSVTELPQWQALVEHLKVKAFTEITVASSMREGARQLARISGTFHSVKISATPILREINLMKIFSQIGLGAMKPNTVILGFGSEGERFDNFANPTSSFHSQNLRASFSHTGNHDFAQDPSEKHLEVIKTVEDMTRLEKNTCLTRNFNRLTKQDKKYIDVWLVSWFTKPNDVMNPADSFAMQLGTILTMTRDWKTFKLRVFIRVMSEEDSERIKARVQKVLDENRIPGQVVDVLFQKCFDILKV